MPVIRLRDQRRALLGGVDQTSLWIGGQRVWSLAPLPVTYLRADTLTSPSLATSLGPFSQRGPRPYVNQFKMSEPWRASNTGGGNTEYAALVSAGTITQEGQINAVPAGLDNITTRLLEFLMPDMGCGPRWTLMWDGEGSAYIQGGQNVVESPGRIDFDFTANGQNFINLLVTGVTTGPLRNFRLINEFDMADYEAGLTFRPAYVDEVRNYRALRMDNWVNIVENQTTDWSSRCTPAYETYRAGFAPLEHCVDICNLVGADLWFCHPYQVTDDYVTQAAALVRDRLDDNRLCYVEYAQKCWDFATPQAHYCREQGDLLFGVGGPQEGENYMEWYGVRSAQVARIWRTAWGATDRLHTVFETHTDWEGLEEIGLDAPRYVAMDPGNEAPSTAFTDYAVHSQIDGGMAYGEAYTTVEEWRTTLTETEVFDRMRDQSLTAAHFSIPGGRYVDNMIVTWGYHKGVADSYGLSMICYDGGSHLHAGGAALGNSAHTSMLSRYHYSSQFAEVAQAMLDGYHGAGGDLFSWSVHSRPPEPTINVGLRRYEGDTNPVLAIVETWNATHAGPAGRGAEDFVGPQDRTEDAPAPSSADSVVIIGASLMEAMFGSDLSTPSAEATSLLAAAGHDVPVYGYTTPGAWLEQADAHYSAARAAHPNALILAHFWGNNISDGRPYPGGQSLFDTGLADLLAVAQGDDRFYPMSASFRDYDDTTFQNPDAGSKPYNENLLLPWITANFPQAMTSYGRPVFDHYRRVLQDFERWLSADNIHLTPTGYTEDRAWIVSVIASVLDGLEPAEIVERIYEAPQEPSVYPDLVTSSGIPTFTEGRFGQAMDNSGTFYASADSSLTPLTDTWGVEWWFRIPPVEVSEIGWGESGSAIYFVLRTGGRSPAGVTCITYASGGTTREIFGGPRVDDNEWHHGKIQFSTAGADLFVDGVLVDHDDGQIDANRPRGDGSHFTIGHYGSATPYIWNGQMDEVRIFDGLESTADFTPRTTAYETLPANTVAYWALDGDLTGGIPAATPTGLLALAPDALQIMDAASLNLTDGANVDTWADLSPNGRDLTGSGAPYYRTDGTLHWVELLGDNEHLYRNEAFMRPAVEAGRTVTVQIAVRATPSTDRRLIAEGHSGGGSAFYAPIQSTSADAQQLSHYLRTTANTTLVTNNVGVLAFAGGEHTIAVEDTGSVVRTYVDGTLVREVAYTQGAGDPITVDRFALGAVLRATAGSFFRGDIFAYVINPEPYNAEIDAALAEIAGIDRTQPEPTTSSNVFVDSTNDGFVIQG